MKSNQDCCPGDANACDTSNAATCDTDCFAPVDTTRQNINLSDEALAELAMVSLEESLDPFIDRFNAAVDKTRVVALVSPTCGGCVEGARAVQKSIIEAYPNADLSVHIIWEPMLASDNERQARRSSIIFPGSGVHQYYDANRRSGRAYLDDLFPNYRDDIAGSVPADHPVQRYCIPGESGPLWDLYAVYPPGATWGKTTPRPAAWVKQVLYYADRSGLMWADDFHAPPLESNLRDEVGALMTRLHATAAADSALQTDALQIQMLAFPGCPNAKELMSRLKTAIQQRQIPAVISEVNLESLDVDDPRRGYGAPTIYLHDADLLGAAPQSGGAWCCRIYDLGALPDAESIGQRLQAVRASRK